MLRKFLLFIYFILWPFYIFAQDLTILYTGETHAMLYPCSCPVEPDGGVARRGSLIKQLRQEDKNLLLLDSGAFFAGGMMDEYTQNSELDMKRTEINLKAMEAMSYDALNISDDEFNFGKEYLRQAVNTTKINFLSCNISLVDYLGDANWFKPYVIKEVSGITVGIIGLSNEAITSKVDGIKFTEPKIAAKKAIEELKQKGVHLIILLSQLGETQDLEFVKEIPEIDVLIAAGAHSKEGSSLKQGSTLILRPSWQGRKLGKAILTIKDKKISSYKVEEIRLSDKVKDDPQILSILPVCFSDNNCKKEAMVGACNNPGTIKAACSFASSSKVSLTIITTKDCFSCKPQEVIDTLKKIFPGLTLIYEYYPSLKAKQMVKDYGIKGLPAYLLGKEADKENSFNKLKDKLEAKGNYYLLKPEFVGISYLVNREKIKGKLDLFISLYDRKVESPTILANIKDFKPEIHFLVAENNNQLNALAGNLEVEDYLRAVCVKKYYPERFWGYISCRAKDVNTSWWQDCLEEFDYKKIETCARTDEGRKLLSDNIGLGKELKIMFGPTYLLDNQEIFGIEGTPKKEDYKKIFKR